MNQDQLRLYLVADPDHGPPDLVSAVFSALQGGVTAVQLRAKSLTDRELLNLARQIREACSRHNALFFVNDRLDIALATRADGVHLGVDDLPLDSARELTGPGFLIGYSPETGDQVALAAAAGADYLGVGPVYGTATKADAGDALGLGEFARRCAASTIPVVGIGGISAANAPAVTDAGAAGVAVISAILSAADPEAAAREMRDQVDTTVR